MSAKIDIPIRDKIVTLETGDLAFQAGGSIIAKCEETVVFITATCSNEVRKGMDFFPLLVDYEEKMYSIGKIPGSFTRREGKASESAILTSRLIDRSVRPLFPSGFRNDVQIVAYAMSCDQVNQPDILALIGASAALSISDIPFNGPVGGVRVGLIDGEWVINPTFAEMAKTDLDLVVAGTKDEFTMVEAGAKIVPEDVILKALEIGYEESKKIIEKINEFVAMVGKEKRVPELYTPDDGLRQFVLTDIYPKIQELMTIKDIVKYKEKTRAIVKSYDEKINQLDEKDPIRLTHAARPFDLATIIAEVEKKEMRKMVLNERVRVDGRGVTEIRKITSKAGLLPRAHGSGLFTRGLTQVMSILTLGSASDAQMLDEIDPETNKRYLHHYNFPGFSTGEVRPMRFPGRREIGHGALASRAIQPVLPGDDEFPYTIRIVSEILSSNGSTSMASTCGSTLALMDAGVPIKAVIGGIAMGMIKEGDQYVVLSDIQGLEDFLGDMDFKVTGSTEGVTALQMDIKAKGVSVAILREALEQAREGRLHIIQKMKEAIEAPRDDLSPYAPRIVVMYVSPEFIGEIIGPAGKNIKKIIEETGVKIDIEDSGRVLIVSNDPEGSKRAQEIIGRITQRIEIGRLYTGTVTRITNYGAFVEVEPQQEGMVHISQLAEHRVANVEEVLNVGDTVKVRVTDIDHLGRIYLTCRGLDEEFTGNRDRGPRDRGGDRPPRRDFGDRGDRGGRGGGDRDRKRY